MVGQSREPERDNTTLHSRPEQSPTRSASSSASYRERSGDRSNARVTGGSVPSSDKKKVLKKQSTEAEAKEESLKIKESNERGRGRASRTEDKSLQDEQPEQTIADMNNEEMMMKMMGFGSFDSTKGKHVAGVAGGVAKKNKSTKYRQYMNREKGFNRALSPGRKG